MKKLVILFFLVSCTTPKVSFEKSKEILDFNNQLSFVEFNELAIKYAETNPYPNIDK